LQSGRTSSSSVRSRSPAICPPGSLHDHLVKQWPYVRSKYTIAFGADGSSSARIAYVMKDGHLFLALMADGGIYEFEPIGPAKPADRTR
jgi:para-nitrobenzyl esterase